MDKKTEKIRIGQRVRKLRKDKELSQEELAHQIDKSVETISHIERNIFLPRLDTAQEIADALGVPLYELFMYDVADADKEKIKLINELLDVLKDQPVDLLKMTIEQARSFVSLKNSFLNRLK